MGALRTITYGAGIALTILNVIGMYKEWKSIEEHEARGEVSVPVGGSPLIRKWVPANSLEAKCNGNELCT